MNKQSKATLFLIGNTTVWTVIALIIGFIISLITPQASVVRLEILLTAGNIGVVVGLFSGLLYEMERL